MTGSNMGGAAVVAAVVALAGSGSAQAGVTITQGSSAPTYATTLNFDEVGGPLGTVPATAWTSLGIARFEGGAAASTTITTMSSQPGFGWLGSGNVAYAPWGAFITFQNDLTSFSARYWDSSGPGGPFGGGAAALAFRDGVQVASLGVSSPAYGGVGNPWFNFATTGGDTFDEVRLVGFGFFPEAYLDDLSWTAVPSPAGGAVLAMAGALIARRRRA